VASAVSATSTLTNAEVESEIIAVMSIADIDGDGEIDALTDGLIILRYLFGPHW
jgi:TolB-like protein